MMPYSGTVSLLHMLMEQIQLFWYIAKAESFSFFFLYSDPATPLNQFV